MNAAILIAALAVSPMSVDDAFGPDTTAPSLTCMARLEAERDIALGNGAKAFKLGQETTIMWRNVWVKLWCDGADLMYVGEKDGKPL